MEPVLIWATPDAERLIAYITRVSNTKTQDRKAYKKLLKYCIREKHWSPFEMASMCVEIQTTRAISAQIIRHRSFHFQEFSQRYAKVPRIEASEPRRQDHKNRQNSFDDVPDDTKIWWREQQEKLHKQTLAIYDEALEKGIAKESARFLLPMSSYTKIYMNGTLRDWIHYIELRTHESTQLEHRRIALSIKAIFMANFPTISEALGWE